MKKQYVIIFLFLLSVTVRSQSTTKKHYEILADTAIDLGLYKKIVDNIFLDSLRFLHERRIIEITNTPVKIELFSADELQRLYGKTPSPFTIETPCAARKVKLRIVSDNTVELIVQ